MRLYCISGPQGCGKSSTLNSISKIMGDKYLIDPTKFSRKVQADMNVENLKEAVTTDFNVMMDFQTRIYDAIIDHIELLVNQFEGSDKVVIMERSFADLAAYVTIWAGKFNSVEPLTDTQWKQVSTYIQRCKQAQNFLIDHNFYLPFMEHMVFEYDPNRGFEEDIVVFDALIRGYLQSSYDQRIVNRNCISEVQGITPDDRAYFIIHKIKSL